MQTDVGLLMQQYKIELGMINFIVGIYVCVQSTRNQALCLSIGGQFISALCRARQSGENARGEYMKCVQSGRAVWAFHSARKSQSSADMSKKGNQCTKRDQ